MEKIFHLPLFFSGQGWLNFTKRKNHGQAREVFGEMGSAGEDVEEKRRPSREEKPLGEGSREKSGQRKDFPHGLGEERE